MYLALAMVNAFLSGALLGAETNKTASKEPISNQVTHKQTLTIAVTSESGNSLQTMALLSDGRVAALVGPPRYHSPGKSGRGKPLYEVRLFDAAGKLQKKVALKFHGQAVTGGPDGILYVAGDGRIAKFSKEGELVQEIPLPYIDQMKGDKQEIEKQAKETIAQQKRQLEQISESFQKQIKVLEKRIAELKSKPEKDRTKADERRLQRYESQLESYQSQIKEFGDSFGANVSVEDVVNSLLEQTRSVNSIAATSVFVFVVCGETKGHGYAVWKMDTEFKTSKQVLSKLSGCCGQMDVKAHDGKLYVAENTRHHVGVYDYEGKSIKTIGSRSGADGFGSCCNPMNLCIGPNGALFTAESEGIIRQFSAAGEQVALVGKAYLTGGCKNVAIGVSPKGDQVYFCDLPGSRIIVLSPVTDKDEAQTIARKVQREAQPQPQPVAAPSSQSGFGTLLKALFGD